MTRAQIRQHAKSLRRTATNLRAEISRGFQDQPWASAEEVRASAWRHVCAIESQLQKWHEQGILRASEVTRS